MQFIYTREQKDWTDFFWRTLFAQNTVSIKCKTTRLDTLYMVNASPLGALVRFFFSLIALIRADSKVFSLSVQLHIVQSFCLFYRKCCRVKPALVHKFIRTNCGFNLWVDWLREVECVPCGGPWSMPFMTHNGRHPFTQKEKGFYVFAQEIFQ